MTMYQKSFLGNYLEKIKEDKRSSAVIAYLAAIDHINSFFPEISNSIVQEIKDQRSHLKLIASENYSSLTVQLAMGNLLTDKYSEGFPHHRFYAGCDNVDNVEDIASGLLKKIFGCEHAYVQPHSGADANLVAFWSILVNKVQNKEVEKLGRKNINELTDEEYETIRQLMVNQKVMGMSLNSGGHLTHGYRHNVSSKFMKSVSYDVDPKTGYLNYDNLQKQVKKEKPLILIGGYSAYPRNLNFAKLKEIADSVGAVLMVDMAHFAGLVAGKVMTGENNPVPYADIVTSTTHKTLRGPRGGLVLCKNEYKEVVDKGCPLVLGGPMPHVMAAKAIAFKELHSESFCNYAHQIVKNAKALAEELKRLKVKVLTDGTDNHLVLIDVQSSFDLTGRQAEKALRMAKLTVNRNTIPEDKNGPWYTSGIRLGTPAITTLGMKENEMKEIAQIIVDILKNSKSMVSKKTNEISRGLVEIDEKILKKSHDRIENLLLNFPLYPELVIE